MTCDAAQMHPDIADAFERCLLDYRLALIRRDFSSFAGWGRVDTCRLCLAASYSHSVPQGMFDVDCSRCPLSRPLKGSGCIRAGCIHADDLQPTADRLFDALMLASGPPTRRRWPADMHHRVALRYFALRARASRLGLQVTPPQPRAYCPRCLRILPGRLTPGRTCMQCGTPAEAAE